MKDFGVKIRETWLHTHSPFNKKLKIGILKQRTNGINMFTDLLKEFRLTQMPNIYTL